jgi:hypothetical protein
MLEPAVDPTSMLRALRSADGSSELPLHQRTIDIKAFDADGHFVVIGTLHDQRPWASGRPSVRDVHRMELAIVVRRSDLVIVDAEATMDTFPHAECTDIEGSFSDLIGLSISRGFSRAVQARLGRERGCSHLEFLARALAPVVLQSLSSSASRLIDQGREGEVFSEGRPQWLMNTCHIWAEDGVGPQKVAAGWRPIHDGFPAPRLVEIRRRGEPAP